MQVIRLRMINEHLTYLVPGVLVLFGLQILIPEIGLAFSVGNYTAGDFGLFLLVSYAAGHVISSAGTIVESGLWKLMGGRPYEWIPRGRGTQLSKRDADTVLATVKERYGLDLVDLRAAPAQLWSAAYDRISREAQRETTSRLEILKLRYEANRAMAAGFVILMMMAMVFAPDYFRGAFLVAATLAGICLLQMYRAGVALAEETLRNFIDSARAGAVSRNALEASSY